MNTLYYGDNLDILKNRIATETVDLIYLDPPFQSGKDYNQIFQPRAGEVRGATAQARAFKDTWTWGPEADREYMELIAGRITTEPPTQKLIDLMKAMRGYLRDCPLMAYLCMMAPRLVEMRRTLKPTGSIYLHCDPSASHYLKLLMDGVFEARNFRNEVVWCYTRPSNIHKRYPRTHHVIFFYTKKGEWTFNRDDIRVPYNSESEARSLRGAGKKSAMGAKGKDRLHKGGKVPEDWWPIPELQGNAAERLGYPTQKPVALLKRIIKASSNEGDLVLDPFCGCGTTIAAAQELGRRWTGIDITYLAVNVIKTRLAWNSIKEGEHFKVEGVPQDVYSAGRLAEAKPREFEYWAVSRLNATPTGRAGDQGVDGVINFVDPTRSDRTGKGVISVKGGRSINPAMVRELRGTIERQGAEFGILITLEQPTRGMITEAGSAGSYSYSLPHLIRREIPRIQLLTAADLFAEPMPVKLPPDQMEPYRKPTITKEQRVIMFKE